MPSRSVYFDKTCKCPFCTYFCYIQKLPDYETPAQYEKRTGKKWNGDGAVWCRVSSKGAWFIESYNDAVENMFAHDFPEKQIVCAQSSEPPPDDWKPEEEI
jgi:hypothetical protein